MPLVEFSRLMAAAEPGGYAVGYFESWNLESLLAVADAAQAVRAPVILGFSGIYLPHPDRQVLDPLAAFAAMGLAVGQGLSVPCCLEFNESPHCDWVLAAIDHRFQLVMYTRDDWTPAQRIEEVQHVAERAHAVGAAVEGEIASLQGLAGDLEAAPADLALTDPQDAVRFVEAANVDALAVNVGQVHLHGRRTVPLDFDRLRALRAAVATPLVLHGASSVAREDLRTAVQLGIRKVNFGSVLKQTYLKALCSACREVHQPVNPYEVIGSGLSGDVLVAGRLALQGVVEEYMKLIGSAGQAGRNM